MTDPWTQFTLQDCIDIMAIEPPEKFTAILDAERINDEGKSYTEALQAIDDEDIFKVFPEFYGRIIERFAGIDVTHMGPGERTDYFEQRIRVLYSSLYHASPLVVKDGQAVPYTPPEIESFEAGGQTLYLPRSLKIFDDVIPAYEEQAVTFTEAADICTAITGVQREGIKRLPMLMAVYCRPKGEQYSEADTLKREPLMYGVDMDKVWAVFFLHQSTVERIRTTTKHIFKPGNPKARGKGGDAFGYRGWIYEIAKTGMHGTVSEVERVHLYEFINTLEYTRDEQEKINEAYEKAAQR